MKHIAMSSLMFLAASLLTGNAICQERYLIVGLQEEAVKTNDSPEVSISGTQVPVTAKNEMGYWIVPIKNAGQDFVTSYRVRTSDNDTVTIQLDIPSQILEANQSVYLYRSTFGAVDEASIRQLWSTNQIFQSPSDQEIQFKNLQDLVDINDELKKRRDTYPNLNSMNVRAAFLLLNVVRNLAQNTWYVVDPDTREVIEYAETLLASAEAKGLTCRWLAQTACANNGIRDLIANVRQLENQHITRMYGRLVPDDVSLTADSCVGMPSKLRSFLSYLQSSNGSGGNRSISEGRVLNDIARCETSLALCGSMTPEARIQALESVRLLLDKSQDRATSARLFEVKQAMSQLAAGSEAVCPDKLSPPKSGVAPISLGTQRL